MYNRYIIFKIIIIKNKYINMFIIRTVNDSKINVEIA